MPTWSTSADTTPETIDAIQTGLTVRLVMTERSRLMTCSTLDSIDSLMANNVDRFSVVPVLENGLICGLYRAERWFDVGQPPRKPVGKDFEHLTEEHLIGSSTSILNFVMTADERPIGLVVSGPEIVGLVCLADFHKLPVRAALFSIVTALELAMADLIRDTWPDGPNGWLCLLSADRRKEVEDRNTNARQNDTFVSHILSTQFADKATIILKQGLLSGSKTRLKRDFRAIQKLRDDLAHSKDYAETTSAAKSVSRTVTTILSLTNRIGVTAR